VRKTTELEMLKQILVLDGITKELE
jgi:hypothetical protein